jgi:DNA-binding MarR family transcriptional regulator
MDACLYAEDGSGGPGFLEVAVLVRLAREGPVAPTAIANHEKVTSQAISPVLRALEGRGLVIRAPDPGDARKTVVTITEPGRSILQDREQAVIRGLIDALSTRFTDDEIR